MLLILDNYLKIRDLNKYKDNKIKFVVDNRKKYVVILVYFIL